MRPGRTGHRRWPTRWRDSQRDESGDDDSIIRRSDATTRTGARWRADTVSVTVINGLPPPILVEDHQSGCTVVTLERQVDGGWLVVAPCQLETPTLLLSIPSGAAQTVTLRPAGGPQPRVWQAGTYRFALRYSAGDEGQTKSAALAPAAIVYSQTFTIG